MNESLLRRVANALLGLESLSDGRTATRPHATMRLTQKRPRTACDGRGHGHQEEPPMTRKKVTPPVLLVREYRAGQALCMCGCGEPVSVATATRVSGGRTKGRPCRYIKGHATRENRRRDWETRFWAKVEKGPAGDCWLWVGNISNTGYGQVGREGRMLGAHRVAYELLVGPIPNGLVIDHLCRNTACVNPAHLEPVTDRENMLRGIGPSAQNARKTHCKRGHPLSGDNLAVRGGSRRCRKCAAYMQRLRTRKAT